MAKRLMREPQNAAPQSIDIDTEKIERKKAQRLYHLNVLQIPALRALGFGFLAICILFHNLLLLKTFSWTNFFSIISIIIVYSLSSWIILYYVFETIKKFDIALFLLV